MHKHYIGFWAQTIYDDPLIFPHEVPRCTNATLREAMVRYLNAGTVHTVYRGYYSCCYHCGISGQKMGHCDLTDGMWVWPSGLAHYVDTHHISLPPEVVNSVMELPTDPSHSKYTTPDDYWNAWCQQQRTQSNKHLVLQLREQCDREYAQMLEQKYESQTRATETSGKKCIWRGCSAAAFNGRVFCARHLDARNDEEVNSSANPQRAHYTDVFLESLASEK